MKEYSYEEAVAASSEYFKGDDLAATVWVSKYALKDSFGHIYEKSPEQMHERIADEIVRIERKYPNPMAKEEVLGLIEHFRYVIPQGGPMTGIGNHMQIASLSNCFVIGHKKPADSYGGIIRIDEEQVQLMKRRGGVGHDLSHLRPTGTPVLNSALTSTGIVPFMERYSNSTREVAQDGRRGALMLSLSIKHPDAEKFIDAKVDTGKVTGANISIKIDDAFMKAALSGKKYCQQFPIDAKEPFVVKDIDAKVLWKKIIHNAWKSAEPGVLFWDTVIRESVPDCYADLGFKTVSTNPCGEIPLCPYDSCRLLAMNLYGYVDKPFTKEASFNIEKFKSHVYLAMRMMDDIIDLELEKIDAILEKINKDPEEDDIRRVERELWYKIKDKAQEGRRTGLGITAEGDMLAALGFTYGTDEAIDFAVKVQKTLAVEAYRASVKLAKERGAFLIYDAKREEKNPMIQRIRKEDEELYQEMVKYGRRNIAMLTIAPTGTTSLMSQTTSGIEPVFLPFYKRRRKVNPNDKSVNITFVDEVGDSWEEYYVFHHKFIVWAETQGYTRQQVAAMSNEQLDALVKESPYYKATSNDIDWVNKVKMQGAMQKWVDHSISVTVNLPKDVTEELVADVYQTAWECGCKGVTVYRDGSRDGVLVSAGSKKQEDHPLKRPKELQADVIRFKNGKEDWIAFVGIYNGRPYEIFTGKIEEDAMYIPKRINKGVIIKVREEDGSKRYDFQYEDKYGYKNTVGGISRLFDEAFWNYAKLISGVLRNGMPILHVVTLVSSLHFDIESINTWKNGVARALSRYIPTGTKSTKKCSECGEESLVYQEGCLVCTSCGHSKCG
ncbi:MAG TPA: adenosylcobalamin-dependent ribonucleoside-diphosphate reductase [Candidatus Avirikenella pullistercoris]|nr:adenosylcobalamin-dependent ribonucleoside-diphosphate reductase [Candidatus Avirikenella pullistercoris]